MRIRAEDGYWNWDVIDANTGLKVPLVNWADDLTHEIGQWVLDGGPLPIVRHVPKVVIDPSRQVVLINVRELPEEYVMREVSAPAYTPAEKAKA